MARLLLVVLCCCVYTPCYTDDRRGDTSRGAPQGAELVLGTRGESTSFCAGPFKDYCEWSFLGQDKSAPQGKDVVYSDGRTCPDQVFDHYRDRVKPTCSGAFLLQNTLSEDAGFYRLQCDEQPTRYYHLRVVDPVCNVSITHLPSENGVLLYCNSTGSGSSIAWTRDGSSLPESHLLTDNHTLSIPRDVACGCYQCSVVCGVLGQRNATINLSSPDFNLRCTHVNAMSWGYAVLIVVAFVVLLVAVVLCKCCTAFKNSAQSMDFNQNINVMYAKAESGAASPASPGGEPGRHGGPP
ncbi:uncharacterized protein LOC144821899 [Lissotriton helveticus]